LKLQKKKSTFNTEKKTKVTTLFSSEYGIAVEEVLDITEGDSAGKPNLGNDSFYVQKKKINYLSILKIVKVTGKLIEVIMTFIQ